MVTIIDPADVRYVTVRGRGYYDNEWTVLIDNDPMPESDMYKMIEVYQRNWQEMPTLGGWHYIWQFCNPPENQVSEWDYIQISYDPYRN